MKGTCDIMIWLQQSFHDSLCQRHLYKTSAESIHVGRVTFLIMKVSFVESFKVYIYHMKCLFQVLKVIRMGTDFIFLFYFF